MTTSKQTVLFFSRGRGRGHAIPDLAIFEALRPLTPQVEWVFASYAAGAVTLAEAGLPVIDLQLADDAPFLEVMVRAARAMVRVRADAVVSHEEFAALPAASVFGKRALFLVDFFPSGESRRESLRYADRILFIEHRGVFGEPRELQGRVQYLGPVLRPLVVSRADRARLRQELGFGEGTRVLTMIPGAWANEKRAPLFDLVLAAFRALPGEDRRLVWVAGAEHEALAARVEGASDVRIVCQHNPIEALMVASDLALTKANRGTTIDLARLGVPSLSLSFGLNPIDEAILPRLNSNLHLDVRGLDAPFLTATFQRLLAAQRVGPPPEPTPLYARSFAPEVAREIASFLATRAPI